VHILFLLGSGASRGAAMPTVAELTEQVLSARFATRWAGRFVVRDGPAPNAWDAVDPDGELMRFVRDLDERAAAFFRKHGEQRTINYEDIAFFAAQVADCLAFEYENPALDAVIEQLAATHTDGDERRLAELADETREYVTSTVASCLDRPPARLDYLALVADACRSAARADVATLNHDTVLEQALRHFGVTFSDGFERTVADRTDAWTDSFSAPVRLLKLHGSINWYRYEIGHERLIARSDAADPFHLPDLSGQLLDIPAGARGQFLAGTFNKILAYQSPVYAEQHGHFRAALRDCDVLIIAGYGFADKAVNTLLTGYVCDGSRRPIVLIHADPQSLFAAARPAASRGLKRADQQGRLILVQRWLEDVAWDDLREHMPTKSS